MRQKLLKLASAGSKVQDFLKMPAMLLKKVPINLTVTTNTRRAEKKVFLNLTENIKNCSEKESQSAKKLQRGHLVSSSSKMMEPFVGFEPIH